MAVYDTVLPALPFAVLLLLGNGGLLYSGGIAFHTAVLRRI
jgi:hypothetical protein